MKIVHYVVPPRENNVFVVYDESSLDAIVIDPALGTKPVTALVKERGLKVSHIVNTHGHANHTADNAPVKTAVGGKIAIHDTDAHLLELNAKVGAPNLEKPPPPSKAEVKLKEATEIPVGSHRLRVLHTPGHTTGSVCLYERDEGVLFTGDTVMHGMFGRYDAAGGSFARLVGSLRRLLDEIPLETRILPGHGPFSDLEAETPWLENLRYASPH
jgi:glyoxylase-like metal-dependent hydrolase (beta-lactamase superfamily II)